MDKIDEVLNRGVEKIYPDKKALEKVLRSGKKIRLYQGFDPSMPSLHLGNFVGLLKLRQFQNLGHEVIFLVGDFTGMIGDPTGKLSTRPQLTRKQVLTNAKNWKKQADKVLKFSGKNPAKIFYNSQWSDKLSSTELLKLASNLTYQQTIKRDMFQKRLKQNQDIFLHEFLYPLMQGYDSVAMDVDLEIGGSDQMFNMLVGRDLMRKLKNKEKFVMTTKLLVDAQGQKVGKTTGNALFLDSTPEKFYGGVMSFPDEIIGLSFELLTEMPLQLIKQLVADTSKVNPMQLKKKLAFEIVKLLWGENSAQKAQEEFERVFQQRKLPNKNEVPVFKTTEKNLKLDDLLIKSNLTSSKSEAKRLIKQGAVEINGKKITNNQTMITLEEGVILRAGKRKFVLVRFS